MNTQRNQRTWTDNDDKSSSKWLPITLLSVLLLAGLYIFFSSVLWTAAPKTFAISIGITEYDGNLLPQPAYAQWQMNAEQFESEGLVSWEFVQNATPSGRTALIKALNSIDDELADQKMAERDTLVVYLRGHAIAHNGKAYLLTNDFDRPDIMATANLDAEKSATDSESAGSGISRSAIPIDDILKQLQELKAGNVVLLADICDLRTAPKLGVIANNVAELIQQSVANLSGKTLWVITANASLQPAHISFLRERTLLQSACEFACDANAKEKEDKFLSLARFYEAMLRYSHDVTEQKQTPLLFRSGTSDSLSDPDSLSWKAAQQVRIASFASTLPKDAEDLENLVPPEKATASSRNGRNPSPFGDLRFVAYTQEPSGQVPPNSPTASDGNSNTPDSPISNSEPPGPVASTPALQFWQLHDALLQRNNGAAGWSPIDFAASRWRQMELEACKLERATRFSSRTQILEDQRLLNRELEQLSSAVQAGMAIPNPNDLQLIAAWNRLQSDLTADSGKLPWKTPEAIPESEETRWRPIREGYREYLDTVSQLSGWLANELHNEQSARNQSLQSLKELVQSLRSLDPKLPNEADISALDRPLQKSDLDPAQQSLGRLREQRDRQADEVLAKLKAANSNTNNLLHWSDERAVQALLQDTQLSFAKRAELTAAYDALSAEQLEQPGDNGHSLDRNLDLPNLLANPGTKGELLHLTDWSSVLQESLQLAGMPVPPSPASNSPTQLNDWAYQLINSQPSKPVDATTAQPANAWKQACLNDLDLFSNAGDGSLIVSVSKDQSMHVSLPASVQLPQPLICELKRRNGASVDRCYFKWRLLNASEFPASSGDLLVATSSSGQVLEQGVDTPLAVKGSQTQVAFVSSLEMSSKSDVLKIEVAVADQANAPKTNWIPIDIYPRNPDRIDLYAKIVNPESNEPAILWSVEDSESGNSVLRELAVPAVGQAKRAFELYLANLSDQEKLVVASIYAVQSDREVGNGRATPRSMIQTRNNFQRLDKLFVSSSTIQLPKNSSQLVRSGSSEPKNGKRIVLVPAQAETAANSASNQESIAAFGEFGLVCVLQEVLPGAEGQPPIATDKEPTWHWIDCVPLNPFPRLVSINAKAQAGRFAVEIGVPQTRWALWDIQELNVSARVTDTLGNPAPGSQELSAVLMPESEPATLYLSPRETANQPMVLHLDIGGYPRAINYESRLSGLAGDAPRGANRSFVWLEQEGLICVTADGKPISTEILDDDKVVVPARENVDDKSDGTRISVAKLIEPLQIDFPKKINSRSTAEVSLAGVPKTFDFDRRFIPRFSLGDGNLVFSATVRDLVFELPLQNYDLTGRKTLKAQMSGSPESSSKAFEVVFDQIPPTVAKVEVDSTRLYLEESLQLTIDCEDEDSAVRSVYFAIDQERRGEGKYDVNDELHLEAKPRNGRWTATLEASDLEDYPKGDYWIVCRSVDYAGNFQDENRRERFEWTKQKRPVAAPKQSPPAKPKPKTGPPPPPVPTKHTVRVEVTVNGGKPPYPEKTNISGLPGATQNNSGNYWIVTKVPEGQYDIKATYSDAFGVAYEGTGKVNVTATSGRSVTIDVKKK